MNTTAIVDQLITEPTPAVMDELIAEFRRPNLRDDQVAYLATRMAESGRRLSHNVNQVIADVPSTGGPSSLSTLVSPLVLVMGGAIVPKLGVPGRPAGGIDTLACIPDFKAQLDPSEVLHCLKASSYAHFLANDVFAPIDALLFAHRRRVGAIDVPALAIASLLAKKLAVGVNRVTLDVRVASYGNFGTTWDRARENAVRFMSVARTLGITATCYLTDARLPYQPHIGRGESLVALARVFAGQPSEDLAAHVDLCVEMANLCLGTTVRPKPEELQAVFFRNLEQQGSTREKFLSRVQQIESEPTAILTATSNGYFDLDLDGIRRSLVSRQQSISPAALFADPCGITLLVPCGTFVRKGEAVARIRSLDNLDEARIELQGCIMQSATPLGQHAPEKLVAHKN